MYDLRGKDVRRVPTQAELDVPLPETLAEEIDEWGKLLAQDGMAHEGIAHGGPHGFWGVTHNVNSPHWDKPSVQAALNRHPSIRKGRNEELAKKEQERLKEKARADETAKKRARDQRCSDLWHIWMKTPEEELPQEVWDELVGLCPDDPPLRRAEFERRSAEWARLKANPRVLERLHMREYWRLRSTTVLMLGCPRLDQPQTRAEENAAWKYRWEGEIRWDDWYPPKSPKYLLRQRIRRLKEERQPKEECDDTNFDGFSSRQAYLEYRDAAIGMGEWPYDDEDGRWEDW